MTVTRLIYVTLLSLASAPIARAETVTAHSAARFHDSIGVNVHARGPYQQHHEALKAKLGELGVRHIRDGAHPAAYKLAMSFHAAHGIKTIWITGRRVGGEKEWVSPLKHSEIDTELREIREHALACTAAIEGPNEYDIHSDKRDPDWPATLRRYQQLVFEKVRADEKLREVPVVGPSLTSKEAYKRAADFDAWIDYACIHHYQSSRHPGTPGWGAGGYGSIDWTLTNLLARQSPTGKPVMNTECGQQTGGGDSKGKLEDGKVPEIVEAKYLPRMFAEFFRRGYFRSYKYELLGKQWGLLRDDLSERAAFFALKNLITLVRDDRDVSTPGELAFTIENAPRDLRRVLLQKSDRTFLLLLWRETLSFDPDKKTEIAVKSAEITLTLEKPATKAQLFEPAASAEPRTLPAGARLPVSVTDALQVVRIEL